MRTYILWIMTALYVCPTAVPAQAPKEEVKFYNLEKEYRQLKTVIFKPAKANALELKYVVSGMLSTHGSVYVNEKNNTLYITDVPEMTVDLEKTVRQLDVEGITAGGNLVSKVIPIKHNKAPDLLNLLTHKLSPDGRVYGLPDQNAVVVTDIASKIEEIEKLIRGLDQVVKQISIEVNIVEVNLEAYSKLGINFFNFISELPLYVSNQEWVLNFTRSKKEANEIGSGYMKDLLVYAGRNNYVMPQKSADQNYKSSMVLSGEIKVSDLVSLIADDGRGKVLATSRLVTRNNNTAFLSSQEKIPYRLSEVKDYEKQTNDSYVWAGLYTAVTPVIQDDNCINMVINPRISDVTGWSPKGMPIVFERSLGTEVNVKDGETYILGGLQKTETVNEVTGVPILKSIPVIRYLFSTTKKVTLTREIIMFITPRIIVNDETVRSEDKELMDMVPGK